MFCSTIPPPKKKYKTHVCFTFGSPSDDAQSTSERKREHPPLSSRWPAAFPQGISLRESEGELLGSKAPLSEHYPCWHVHFLTGGKEKKQALSPSWGSHHLGDIAVTACPAVSMFSSLSGELPVLSGESSPSHSRKQVLLFFLIKPTLMPVSSPNLIRNSLPLVPNSHKLTG